MPKTIFYAAVSLDGYLAGPGGDMSWAEKYLDSGEDYGWAALLGSCGSALMGRNTFEFEQDAGADRILPTYVVTGSPFAFDGANLPGVTFVSGDLSAIIQRILDEHPQDIFVYGGAVLVNSLIGAGLLDEMQLFIAPDVLGDGIRLFSDGVTSKFVLENTKKFPSGLTQMTYSKLSNEYDRSKI